MILLLLSGFVCNLLNGQRADFSIKAENGNFCSPAKISFVPTFSEKPDNFYWQLGQNDEESQANSPVVTYIVPGTYKVVLNVLFKNKVIEIPKMVTIYGSPAISIQTEKEFLCQPGDNNFTLKSSEGIRKAIWNFGSGNVVTTNGNILVKNSFGNFGSYPISAEVEDIRGCKATATTNFLVERLNAELENTPINGCIPAEVNFNSRIKVPKGSTIVNYVWDFDDGSLPQNNNLGEVKHTFNKVDTFIATLSIKTSEGCENKFSFPPVAFGTKPVLTDILLRKDTICTSEEMVATALSPDANAYIWEISDGSSFQTRSNILSYKFERLGEFMVKVTPMKNGCLGDPDSVSIRVIGVIARFAFNNLCTERNRFNFRNTSIGSGTTIQWNFPGVSSPQTIARPEVVFPAEGSFPVALLVNQKSTGCADTAFGVIYTGRSQLSPSDSFACLGSIVSMGVTTPYSNRRATFTWQLAGKVLEGSTLESYKQNALTEGDFINRVIIYNGIGYCPDTLTQPFKLRVTGLKAAFENTNNLCVSDSIRIKNSTFSLFTVDSRAKWSWDFGNETVSNERNPKPVLYQNPGNYTVSLKVTDSNGCTDSTQSIFKIRKNPLLKVLLKEMKVCQGAETVLSALNQNGVKWSPSNLFVCDTCSDATVRPMVPTVYYVSSADSLGCSSFDSVKVDVWLPFKLSRNNFRDTAGCAGISIQYDLDVKDKMILWTPAVGLSSAIVPDPVVKPTVTTTYRVTVSDSASCFTDTASAVFTIFPQPVINPGPDFLLEYDAPFTLSPIYSNNIQSYKWEPANLLSCSNCPNPSGRAKGPGHYSIEVVSDKGCIAQAKINVYIDCNKNNVVMPTAFSPDNNGLNDFYFPLIRGVKIVKRFAIYNRFGEILFERKLMVPNERAYGWDGKYQGKLQPSGSYTYVIELDCASGEAQLYKGNFFLLK